MMFNPKIDIEIVCDSCEVESLDDVNEMGKAPLLVKLKNVELECISEYLIQAIKERHIFYGKGMIDYE